MKVPGTPSRGNSVQFMGPNAGALDARPFAASPAPPAPEEEAWCPSVGGMGKSHMMRTLRDALAEEILALQHREAPARACSPAGLQALAKHAPGALAPCPPIRGAHAGGSAAPSPGAGACDLPAPGDREQKLRDLAGPDGAPANAGHARGSDVREGFPVLPGDVPRCSSKARFPEWQEEGSGLVQRRPTQASVPAGEAHRTGLRSDPADTGAPGDGVARALTGQGLHAAADNGLITADDLPSSTMPSKVTAEAHAPKPGAGGWHLPRFAGAPAPGLLLSSLRRVVETEAVGRRALEQTEASYWRHFSNAFTIEGNRIKRPVRRDVRADAAARRACDLVLRECQRARHEIARDEHCGHEFLMAEGRHLCDAARLDRHQRLTWAALLADFSSRAVLILSARKVGTRAEEGRGDEPPPDEVAVGVAPPLKSGSASGHPQDAAPGGDRDACAEDAAAKARATQSSRLRALEVEEADARRRQVETEEQLFAFLQDAAPASLAQVEQVRQPLCPQSGGPANDVGFV